MFKWEDNPFRLFRAEQITKDLWKFYEPLPHVIMVPRPLVLEGGRGSGKTMFFLCNSWRERYNTLLANKQPISFMFQVDGFIGIYWKADGKFTKYMGPEGRSDWDHIFSTFMGICQAREILEFLECLVYNQVINETELIPAIKTLECLKQGGIIISNIPEAKQVCFDALYSIQNILNDPRLAIRDVQLHIVGLLIQSFVTCLKEIPLFKDVSFRFFIDEYETLREYQQRLINTLIKQSDSQIIYSIGVRPTGMKSNQTINESEVIQEPHDYSLVRIEDLLNFEEVSPQKQYISLLEKICERRIKIFCETQNLADLPSNINWYLGNYDIEYEINKLNEKMSDRQHISGLIDLIYLNEQDRTKAEEYVDLLAKNAHIINSRLHFSLLKRRKRNQVKLEFLAGEYRKWLNDEETKNYKEWYNHTKLALVFLLSKEMNKNKLYFGVDVFAMLSSGVIRYFLELCEKAFDYALLNDFSWKHPCPISPEDQNKSARYVSRNKIDDIKQYEPYGQNLRIFVENIGEIFQLLHQHSNLTLGEPEINHFSTKYFEIDKKTKEIINSAIMWTVLQEQGSSKDKNDASSEYYEYHLNHIYSPYFGISYRRKHKLNIPSEYLKNLLSGNAESARNITLKYINKLNKQSDSGKVDHEQGSLFEGENDVEF
jgi:hypothetical protein